MAKFRIYGDTSYDETLSNNNLGEVLAETLGISEDNLRESKQQKHPKMKYNKHDDLANVDTEKKNKKKNKNKKKANKKNEVSFDVIDGISPQQAVTESQQEAPSSQQAVTESQQEAPSSQLQSKKTSHPHNNWVPKSVIRQYNSMSIFQQIDKKHKPIKPFDVPRLHSLAQQLKKDHPNMAYENILKNQIELYLDILAERKKYYQSKKSDEDRKKMNDNIEAKYQEIITNPSINPIYDFKIDILQTNTVVKTFDNTILAKKNEEYSYYEVDKYQDNFFDAAEILEKLLQPAEQQKKERREVERAQRKKERQNEKKDTSGKETKRNQKEPENKIDSVTPSDSVVSEVRTTPEAVVEGKSVVVENNNSDAGETKESKQADVVPPITSPKDNHEKMPAEKPESNTPQVPQKKETAETKESNTSNQAKNLCVIDIGTNAVKSNLYINGKYKVPFNREIVRNGKELDEKNVVDSVVEFFGRATNNENEEERIDPKRVFIVATEGFRTSKNAEQMKAEILAKTGRKVHVISPEREAFFSIYGGLKLLDEIEPRYVLFIESGGGSTEASVVDREKRGPSSILSTVSLPLGSRESQIDGDEAKTQTVVAENIKQLLENLKNKGVDVSSSLGMVVNSGIASRIMWKKNHKDGEKYNPVHVTNSHYGMSVADFGQEINTFLQVADTNKEKIEDYGITKEEQLPGFKAHAQILKSIMSEIEKQFSGDIKNCQVLTTHGGLKEGLMKMSYWLRINRKICRK